MVKFHGIVNLNDEGEVLCFCSYDEYLRGECSCRGKFDCPEALINIEVLPHSRPSEQSTIQLKKATSKLEKEHKKFVKTTNRIKEGVVELEKAIKNNKHRL